ncbi:MAG: hypothetical protein RJB39_258 [Candidatus Parcubacteria bacterium]|jgi:hypothetical protein
MPNYELSNTAPQEGDFSMVPANNQELDAVGRQERIVTGKVIEGGNEKATTVKGKLAKLGLTAVKVAGKMVMMAGRAGVKLAKLTGKTIETGVKMGAAKIEDGIEKGKGWLEKRAQSRAALAAQKAETGTELAEYKSTKNPEALGKLQQTIGKRQEGLTRYSQESSVANKRGYWESKSKYRQSMFTILLRRLSFAAEQQAAAQEKAAGYAEQRRRLTKRIALMENLGLGY